MNIDKIVIPSEIEDKIEYKHKVRYHEVRQLMMNSPRIRFAEKGNIKGNDVYAAFGQTFGGRYLSVFFVYKPENKTAIIISARDMSKKERKAYGRK
ncbi:MAG: BrnT family toxin [Desulfobacterales bacterium]|nr:BrnT family toxin [Desulfobacterales bacterium]